MKQKDLARSEPAAGHSVGRGIDRAAEGAEHVLEEFDSAFGALWETTMGRGYPPFMQNLARANIELVGFLSRRARAYAEFPAQLARCHSPENVLEQQLRFLQQAMEDYEAATGRVTQALRVGSEEVVRSAAKTAGQSVRMQATSNPSSVKKQTPNRSSRRKTAKRGKQGAKG